jgi:hypothetical protein
MKDIVMLKRLLTIITLLLMALPAYAQQAGNLQSRNNLSDVVSNSSAITNLGLGIAVQCAGVVGDATLINNAITAANAKATGGLVQLLAGKCYINEQAGERIFPMSNVTLKGMGRGVTTIQCNDVTGGTDCIANEPSNNVFTTISNFTMKDFTILGYALTNPTTGGMLIRIGSVTDILIDNVESDYSRNMGMIISGNRVVVTNSRIFRSSADGIAVWDASDALISNNVINGANDDAISVHSDDSAAAPVRSGIIITNNTISESQGISALGPKILTISNNIMRRMETYCVNAGYGGSTQGDTTPIGISITGNTCTDVFARNDQPNPRNMSGVYINVTGGVRLIPSGYSAPPGEPAATSGTVTPLLGTGVGAFFTNSVNTTGIGNSSAYAIDISHNILLRTLPAPTTISSWGDPTLSSGLWVANNGSAGNPFYNGAISETYFHNSGIQLNAAMRHMRISDNTIKTGGAYGIRFDTSTQSVNGDYDDVNITNNSISDFTTSGVGGFAQTAVSHQVYVTDNVFDGDPEFKSAGRGPHGTWLYDYWPIGVDITDITGFTVEGNKFKNLDDTVVAGSGNNRIARNTVYAMPYAVGSNTANQGVGNIPAGPDWTTVAQVSDPTASNYGVTITAPLSASTAMPTTGTFVAGTFISNSSLGNSPTTVIGWSRVTTGSNNVLGTDWIAIYSWFAVSGSGATANITSPTNTTGALNYWNGGALTWSLSTYGGSGNNFSIWDQAGSRAVFSAYPSGPVYIGGGTAAASTAGAAVNIMGQSGGTGNQNGGNVVITPGAATGSGATGTINLLGTTNVTGNLNVTGTGYVAKRSQTPTYASTLSVSWAAADITNITLTGNITITNTGASDGQPMILYITQGSGGSHTVTWGTGTAFNTTITTTTLSTAVGAVDMIELIYRASTGKYNIVAFVQNVS